MPKQQYHDIFIKSAFPDRLSCNHGSALHMFYIHSQAVALEVAWLKQRTACIKVHRIDALELQALSEV